MGFESVVLRNYLTVDVEFAVVEGFSSIVLETDETEKEIGTIRLNIYNSRLTDLCDTADGISGSQYYLISNATKHLPSLELNKKLLTIEEINIDSNYRSKGHGNAALNELLKLAKILSVDYIVLKPAPPNDEASDDKTVRNSQIKRLINFYERFGFQTYTVAKDEPIMALDTEGIEYYDIP
ncbi:GNAT family N-acetyltransferase [Psychrobacillus psychrodurans]|uniref:GNAT family N-acetyltransferase n=1 Tax=Psychrobacillus TaxID=1221880 RepID=UPI001F4DD03B|nr:GNAT family N-acetyltransferase [Psychrobacillus psychrodurans]